MKRINIKLLLHLIVICSAFGVTSCSQLIEVELPRNQIAGEELFNDSATALSSVMNIYALYERSLDPVFNPYLNIYVDDYIYTSSDPNTTEFYQSNVSIINASNLNIWTRLYQIVYQCNAVFEYADLKGSIFGSNTNVVLGEIYFLRAYAFLNLVNLYGEIPLTLTTNVNQNTSQRRNSTDEVYGQIINDLTASIEMLPDHHTNAGNGRVNRWAAKSLLARVHLYRENWAEAEEIASDIIQNSGYSLLRGQEISSITLRDNNETIFQFYSQDGYTSNASNLIASANGGIPTFPLSSDLINSFERTDLRYEYWIDSTSVSTGGPDQTKYYFQKKYTSVPSNIARDESLTVIRLAELFLIRAESRLAQDSYEGALEDLNLIRNRANTKALDLDYTYDDFIIAILEERRKEFIAEWIHRFVDLKRLNLLSDVMADKKPAWAEKSQLLPIPEIEIRYNQNLTQNTGY